MKNIRFFTLVFTLGLFMASCHNSDDTPHNNNPHPPTPPHHVQAITGKWSCTNVPAGLTAKADSIHLTVNENGIGLLSGSYDFYKSGQKTNYNVFIGTADGVNDIRKIILTGGQTGTSGTVEFDGIYSVSGGNMTLEIVQTKPNTGLTAPTPQGGFGSTAGGTHGTDYVQVHHRTH